MVTTARGHAGGAAVTAGLEQHGLAALEQRLHQRIHVLLQQRLAAGDLDQRAVEPIDLAEHIVRGAACVPSWKAYGVSHHEQRRSHAVRRTKTHGRPA